MEQISRQEEITVRKSKSHQDRARLRLSRNPEFYRAFIAGFARSGLSLAEYCRKHHVGESSFRKYRQLAQVGRRGGQAGPALPQLVRVLPAVPRPEAVAPVEFILPGGTCIRLAGLDEAALALLRPLLLGASP